MDPAHHKIPVTRANFFMAFVKIGVMGFGGVGPWARRILVEETGWLSDEEYAALLGMGQILPGPNVVNASVMLGDRYFGPVGSLLALLGIMGPPLVILVGIASVYDRFETVPDVQAALSGMAAAGAGLVLGTSLKIAAGLRRDVLTAVLGVAAVVAVMLKAPLVAIVLVLAPLGLFIKARGPAR